MKLINLLTVPFTVFLLLGCKPSASHSPDNHIAGEQTPGVSIEVGEAGYSPSTIYAKAGKPLSLIFTRTTEKGCGTEITLPDFDIRKPLPFNEAVEIKIVPETSGTLSFTCGMGMYKGQVIVSR